MSISYLIYQAQRPQSVAEQREADVRAGEMTAAVTRLARSLRHSVTGNQDARREGQRPGGAPVSCAISRPQ